MFSCVWLHFKKFSGKYFLVFGKEEGKDKPSKTRTKPRKKNHQRDRHEIGCDGAVLCELQSDDRDLTKARRSRSTARSREASITISDHGRRTGAREIGADWSSGFAGDRRTGLELGHQRSRVLSLSLSLCGNTLKGK